MKSIILAITFAWCITGALACSEDEIHHQTVACYTDCVSHYFDEPNKTMCIQHCLSIQDQQRAACGVTCKMVSGYKICD